MRHIAPVLVLAATQGFLSSACTRAEESARPQQPQAFHAVQAPSQPAQGVQNAGVESEPTHTRGLEGPMPAAETSAIPEPHPMALPCQTDAQCLTHRCNPAAQRCAWPCKSDADCMPGNQCMVPACLPAMEIPSD